MNVQMNMQPPALAAAKSLKTWGDRRGLNPQPPVPQTGVAYPDWRNYVDFTGRRFPSGVLSFPECPAFRFTMNRGAQVCGCAAS